MGKREINIKEAVDDIRRGMSEADLMDKHQLKARGLQSLLSKLVSIGAITMAELDMRMPGFSEGASLRADSKEPIRRRPTKGPPEIKASEAIRDIRSGMSDAELMDKYRVSSSGLQDLFDQLVRAGLIKRSELDQRQPAMDETVDLRCLVDQMDLDELRAFATAAAEIAVIEKAKAEQEEWVRSQREAEAEAAVEAAFSAPPRRKSSPEQQVVWAGEQTVEVSSAGQTPYRPSPPAPKPAPPPNPREVAQDIRLGLNDYELAAKYQISQNQLQDLFDQLLLSKHITKGELHARSSLHMHTLSLPVEEARGADLRSLMFPIPVYEPRNPAIIGRLREVSDRELNVVGIEAEADEIKSLVIAVEKFLLEGKPVMLDARCLWAKGDKEGHVAGFEITAITDDNLNRLRALISELTIGDSGLF